MTHIGILEDDHVLRSDITNALIGLGYSVTSFEDSDEAISVCAMDTIDLFIVDLFIHKDRSFVMEGGLDFISRLRDSDSLMTAVDAPVIAITGGRIYPGAEDPLDTAVLAGADQIMRKPVNLLELLSTVQGLLGLDDDPATNPAE